MAVGGVAVAAGGEVKVGVGGLGRLGVEVDGVVGGVWGAEDVA